MIERDRAPRSIPGRVLVIVPTYNERHNLETLVDGLMRHDGVSVLVVDDASPDGTGGVADELARRYEGRIDVMHRKGRRGLGRSYIDGGVLVIVRTNLFAESKICSLISPAGGLLKW